MENLLREMLIYIGEDPTRDGLIDTPKRIIKSWSELYSGYVKDPKEILAKQFNETNDYNQIVLLKDIPFYSMCEHHMLPFHGEVHIGYLPKNSVVGISKLARLVEVFARRLQIQERMTKEIANAIMEHLEPLGVAVVVNAEHLCMTARGIQKPGTKMMTSAMEGIFKEDQGGCKTEFMKMIGMKK